MKNTRIRFQLVAATLKLWGAWLWRSLFGTALVALLAVIIGAGVFTLAGQIVLWAQEDRWVAMPVEYWFVFPWVSITEDLNLYTAGKHIAGPVNPFITLGVWHLVIDPDTFLPAEGSYWATHRWFGGFSEWLASPDRWLGLHAAVSYLMRLPITVFMGVAAVLFYRIVRNYFDAMNRLIDRLHVSRGRVREWLRQPAGTLGNPHDR